MARLGDRRQLGEAAPHRLDLPVELRGLTLGLGGSRPRVANGRLERVAGRVPGRRRNGQELGDQVAIDRIALVERDSGRVEVDGDTITVTLPGTVFRIVFSKPDNEPGLVASEIVREPGLSVAEQTRFIAGAWRLAVNQARLLGWIG